MTQPEIKESTQVMLGFDKTPTGLLIPGPNTDTYMIPLIDTPVFDRRSVADKQPHLPTNPLSAPYHTGKLLIYAALGEGNVI